MPVSPLRPALRLAALLGPVLLVLAAAACAKPPLPGYGDRAEALRTASRTPAPADPSAGEGYVNVICLAGDSAGRAPYDTLFGCLLRARETGSGVLALPRGVYLGHVSELMTRTLKYYRMEEQFDRYLGYRLVLRFREVRSEEMEARDDSENAGLAAHGAGQVAAFVVGLGYVPLSPVVFLVESGLAERERRQVAEDARTRGVPEPDRGAVDVTWEEYRGRYGRLWDRVAGTGRAEAPEAYVVEECYLERPGRGDMLEVVRRREAPGRENAGGT
ncbi:MAG: hypothetical protein AB1916_15070 [Thermodesulfobacteriota bacterium]